MRAQGRRMASDWGTGATSTLPLDPSSTAFSKLVFVYSVLLNNHQFNFSYIPSHFLVPNHRNSNPDRNPYPNRTAPNPNLDIYHRPGSCGLLRWRSGCHCTKMVWTTSGPGMQRMSSMPSGRRRMEVDGPGPDSPALILLLSCVTSAVSKANSHNIQHSTNTNVVLTGDACTYLTLILTLTLNSALCSPTPTFETCGDQIS